MRAPRLPSFTVLRRIVAAIVIFESAALALLAARSVVSHHGTPLAEVAVLLLGVTCGLQYLYSTRGRR